MRKKDQSKEAAVTPRKGVLWSEKRILRNLAKFTGKKLCQRPFFNKVAGLRPETLLKKRFWPEAATRGVLCKKMFLEILQNSQENYVTVVFCHSCYSCLKLCHSITEWRSITTLSQLLKTLSLCHSCRKSHSKTTLSQLLSCEFCKISKKSFFIEHLWTTLKTNWKHIRGNTFGNTFIETHSNF